MLSYFFIVVLSSFSFIDGKLPDYIVPCKANDPNLNACAKQHGIQALPDLLKGDRKGGLPRLSPLVLDKVELNSDNFELALIKPKITGLEKVELKDIQIDISKKHIVAKLALSEALIVSDYKINGQILVLPIKGQGKSKIEFGDCFFTYVMDYSLFDKSGKQHAEIKHSDISFKINQAKFQFDNLFDGNKELGDNMNKVLNDNPQEVLKDLGGAISKVIDTIASGIISHYFETTPFNEIFLS